MPPGECIAAAGSEVVVVTAAPGAAASLCPTFDIVSASYELLCGCAGGALFGFWIAEPELLLPPPPPPKNLKRLVLVVSPSLPSL